MHLGWTFDELLDQNLRREEPTELDLAEGIGEGELRGYWERTKRWRQACVDEAREAARKIGEGGVRRGEIMNAVGRALGLEKDSKVHDIGDLFRAFPEQEQDLRIFFQWVNELYQYNQADGLGAIPNFPGYNPLSGAVVGGVLPLGPARVDLSSAPTIKARVEIPPVGVLHRVSPYELVRIRETIGHGYLSAVDAWQDRPNDWNKSEVRRTLGEYAKEILEWTAKEHEFQEAYVDVLLGADAKPSGGLLRAIVRVMEPIATTFAPRLAPFIVLAKKGWAAYGARVASQATVEEHAIELRAPKSARKGSSEVNYPESTRGKGES